MKVLHVISGLTTGGAERMLEKLIPELRALGIESEVACLGPLGKVGERLQASVPVHRLGRSFVRRFLSLRSLIRRTKPDALLGWMHPGNLAATAAWLRLFPAFRFGPKLKTKPRLFWTIHQSLYSLDYESPRNAAVIRLNARLSRWPEGIVYVSRTSAAQHAARGYETRRAHVIPIGFDTTLFAPLPAARRAEARAALGMDPDRFWAGLVARDDPKKDPVNFVEAAARVLAAHPEARFLLLGAGMDDPRAPARLAARRLGLESCFLFRGETDRPQEALAALDVLVSASYTEAFPNVIGEAMACEVPCVVTDVGDCAWLLGEAGRVVPPRDPEALARALGHLIDAGPDERLRLGRLGRERVGAHFSLPAIARRYAALLQKE